MTTDEFQVFVAHQRKLVENHIMPCHNWYSKHVWWPRVMFRLSGIVVVIGSLSLPIIATSTTLLNRDVVLTATSMSIAALSSLNTFFRWDAMWRSRTRAGHALQGLVASWEYGLSAAALSDKPEQAALAATEKLFKEAFALVGAETEEFFASLHWPEPAKAGA
jgi:hypothetical protein